MAELELEVAEHPRVSFPLHSLENSIPPRLDLFPLGSILGASTRARRTLTDDRRLRSPIIATRGIERRLRGHHQDCLHVLVPVLHSTVSFDRRNRRRPRPSRRHRRRQLCRCAPQKEIGTVHRTYDPTPRNTDPSKRDPPFRGHHVASPFSVKFLLKRVEIMQLL
jgi:hypothetical protein